MKSISHFRGPSGYIATLTPAARQTTGFTAVSGYLYPVDTTSAALTATLPASPGQGDRVAFYDCGATFQTNAMTIGRNGNTLIGLAEDMTVNTQYAALVLIFDATRGWGFAP